MTGTWAVRADWHVPQVAKVRTLSEQGECMRMREEPQETPNQALQGE